MSAANIRREVIHMHTQMKLLSRNSILAGEYFAYMTDHVISTILRSIINS